MNLHTWIAVAALVAVSGSVLAQPPGGAVSACSDIRRDNGDMETVRSEEDRTMPATGLLELRPSRNSGATVLGWDRNEIAVRVCKSASAPTMEGTVSADTRNGPLTLALPEGYASGVRIDTSRHSPLSCRAVQCRDALRAGDGRLEFGRAPFVISLRTVNGPVSVKAR